MENRERNMELEIKNTEKISLGRGAENSREKRYKPMSCVLSFVPLLCFFSFTLKGTPWSGGHLEVVA